MKHLLLFICALMAGSPLALAGNDYPRFRGENNDGVAAGEKGLLRAWPATGPTELWRVTLSRGYGSGVIYDEKVYVADSELKKGKNYDVVRALDLKDGKELWNYSCLHSGRQPVSHSNPAVNENHVVTISSSGVVTCLERKDGKLAWQIDLVKDYELDLSDDGRNRVGHYGVAQNPLIDGDAAIIAPGSKKALIISVELKSGKVLWTTENRNGWLMTHTSIMPLVFNGVRQYVYSSFDGVVAVSAKDGTILWEYPEWKGTIYDAKKTPPVYHFMIPSPVVIAPDRLFFTNEDPGCMMLALKEAGGKIEPSEVFRLPHVMPCRIQTPIFFGGHIFGTGTDDGLMSMSLDGKILWRRKGIGPWGFLIADSMIYVLSQTGTLYLLDATGDEYKELAGAEIPYDKKGQNYGAASWSPMAISDGRLVLRLGAELVCLKVKADAARPQ